MSWSCEPQAVRPPRRAVRWFRKTRSSPSRRRPGTRAVRGARGIGVGAPAGRARALAAEGKTAMYLALAGRPLGLVAAADVLKPEAAAAVAALKRLGLGVVMLTGDSRVTAEAIARQAGGARVLARGLPEDKTREIQRLQAEGRRVPLGGGGVN